MTKPTIWLAPDIEAWALGRIALAVKKELSEEFDINASGSAPAKCDLFVEMYWPVFFDRRSRTKATKSVVGSFSCSWPKADIIGAADAVAISNSTNLENYGKEYPGKALYLCEDGVDCDEFQPSPLPATFTVGWAGHSEPCKRQDLVKDGCRIAGVPLVYWDRREEWRPFSKMPEFYQQVSTVICASDCEGTPLPIIEALACGRPVISTRCGLVPKLVHHGINGFLLDHNFSGWPGCPCPRTTAEDIAKAITDLKAADLGKMGRAARRTAEANSWKIKARVGWGNLFHDLVDG